MVLSGHQVLIQVFSIPDDLGDGGGYSDGINDDNGSCYGKGTPSESCPATGWARCYVIEVFVFLMILVTVMVDGGEENARCIMVKVLVPNSLSPETGVNLGVASHSRKCPPLCVSRPLSHPLERGQGRSSSGTS